MEKKYKKTNGCLRKTVKRREAKRKGEKERYSHLNAEFQRIARRDKKAFLSDQCKEIEENNRMEEKAMAPHSSTLAWKIPWMEVHDIVQETGIKTIPMEKKYKKAKWLSEEALQIAVTRREQKAKERGKDIPI